MCDISQLFRTALFMFFILPTEGRQHRRTNLPDLRRQMGSTHEVFHAANSPSRRVMRGEKGGTPSLSLRRRSAIVERAGGVPPRRCASPLSFFRPSCANPSCAHSRSTIFTCVVAVSYLPKNCQQTFHPKGLLITGTEAGH